MSTTATERLPYRATGEYGFTNDSRQWEAVRRYVAAAVADGWTIRPTYGDREPVDSAATLARDGFVMMVLARDRRAESPQRGHNRRWAYEAKVSLWGPDGAAIRPPEYYEFEEIQAGLRRCNNCGANDIEPHGYSFAGRCCADCLPEMRRRHEYPGWCN